MKGSAAGFNSTLNVPSAITANINDLIKKKQQRVSMINSCNPRGNTEFLQPDITAIRYITFLHERLHPKMQREPPMIWHGKINTATCTCGFLNVEGAGGTAVWKQFLSSTHTHTCSLVFSFSRLSHLFQRCAFSHQLKHTQHCLVRFCLGDLDAFQRSCLVSDLLI